MVPQVVGLEATADPGLTLVHTATTTSATTIVLPCATLVDTVTASATAGGRFQFGGLLRLVARLFSQTEQPLVNSRLLLLRMRMRMKSPRNMEIQINFV